MAVNSQNINLRLGTRRSLLAVAQSTWVKNRVEELNPGVNVELIKIDTRGDKILDIPLQSVEGKDFFVQELDDALRRGEVDFNVHSMKDLSVDRPDELITAAVPRREDPRDILVLCKNYREILAKNVKLKIGSSSPRRNENIPTFLSKLKIEAEFVNLRGNVNTRLSRVHESEKSEKRCDGVVLAFAGILRLLQDPDASVVLQQLLTNTEWLILPISENPTAPAQGALSIECLKSDLKTYQIINKIHDEQSLQDAKREREVLKIWGGGCHQKLGATSIQLDLGQILIIRGEKPNGLKENTIERANVQKSPLPVFNLKNIIDQAEKFEIKDIQPELKTLSDRDNFIVFISHSRCISQQVLAWLNSNQSRIQIFAAGLKTSCYLRSLGFHVVGMSELYGVESLTGVWNSKICESFKTVVAFTHEEALDGWEDFREKLISKTLFVMASYAHSFETHWKLTSDQDEELQKSKTVFIGSFSQYNQIKAKLKKSQTLACLNGKTAKKLLSSGITPLVYLNYEEFEKGCKT